MTAEEIICYHKGSLKGVIKRITHENAPWLLLAVKEYFRIMTNNFIPDCPYKENDELVEILKSKKLKISKEDESLTKSLLQSLGYSNFINKYKQPFIKDNKEYKPNTSIQDLYQIYYIDSKIQSTFISTALRIQMHLANTIGNIMAKHFGINSDRNAEDYYLKPEYFNNQSLRRNLEKELRENKYNPTRYYRENKNHIPPWILTQNLYFGTLTRLYKSIDAQLKNEIIQNMFPWTEINEPIQGLFFDSLEIIRCFRNFAAHSQPMYSSKADVDNPLSYTILSETIGNVIDNRKQLSKNGLYSAMIAAMLLCTHFQRQEFISDLELFDVTFTKKIPNNYKLYKNYVEMPHDYLKKLKLIDNILFNLTCTLDVQHNHTKNVNIESLNENDD